MNYSQIASQPQNIGNGRKVRQMIRGAGYLVENPPLNYPYINSIPMSETSYLVGRGNPQEQVYVPKESTVTKKTTLF